MEMPVHVQILYDDIYRALINAVTYVVGASVPGDVVEFGTGAGLTANVLGQFLKDVQSNWADSQEMHGISSRNLHLFDSFMGLPVSSNEIDLNSPHVRSGVWSEGILTGITQTQLEQQILRYLPPEQLKIYPGFFKDTLTDIPKETRFALIHMDCDLYESCYQVLSYLFKHQMIEEGAIILFDDWNCNRASPEFGERRAWKDIQEKYWVEFSDLGFYSALGQRMIIHSYSPRA